MTNQNQFRDEEYQFPHDEFLDTGLEEPSITPQIEPEQAPVADEPKPSVLAGIWEKHKRIIIIIGAVLVIGIVFAIMRSAHKPVVIPVKAPEAPSASVVQAPQAVIDPQVVEQLTALKQDSVNNSTAVQQLQGQVQQLNDSLNQSRADQQQLAQSLMMLASQMQQLTAEVKVLAQPKPEVKAPKPVVKAEPAPVITFQLRAVVPGRAWVVGSDGRSLSVAIGDLVPQYGSVQSIDADAGVVITTSGKSIKFQ